MLTFTPRGNEPSLGVPGSARRGSSKDYVRILNNPKDKDKEADMENVFAQRAIRLLLRRILVNPDP